jgi:putative phosphoesterase
MLVGVVSDTHGRMHAKTLAALAGAERILHAGDVGDPAILQVLSTVAPVTAVRGNVDRGDLLAATEAIELGGVSIYMLHILAEIDIDPAAAGFSVVVSGHTHQPKVERKRGVLYLNPGSCGPRRFKLPITIARLRIEGGRTEAEIVTLVD